MSLLKRILETVHPECLTSVCEDSGCSLSLQGLEPDKFALLDLDCAQMPELQAETRCDFLFFGWIPSVDRFVVGPIELTRGSRKPWTEVRDQLSAGARLAEGLLPEGREVYFAPVAAGPFKQFKEERIRSLTIPFRDGTFFPAAVRCESDLLEALRIAVGN